MATYTTNYNLEKPEASDPFGDFRESYNDNLDIIDANLGGGGGGGDTVSWTQIQASGTKIAEIDINGTSQDVYAPSGGGGGDVEDVEVNGVSVVDGNNVAKITSYKEVTQAQYDALPNTKLTDGIAYFIKDGTSPTYDNEYSTTEKVVGTWTNSKPVYQLTVELSTFTIPTSGSAWWNLKTDVAKLIGYFGGYTCLGNQFMFGEVIYNDGNTSDILKTTVSLYQNSNNTVAVKFTQKISSVNPQTATNLFITIRYTKTTD